MALQLYGEAGVRQLAGGATRYCGTVAGNVKNTTQTIFDVTGTGFIEISSHLGSGNDSLTIIADGKSYTITGTGGYSLVEAFTGFSDYTANLGMGYEGSSDITDRHMRPRVYFNESMAIQVKSTSSSSAHAYRLNYDYVA